LKTTKEQPGGFPALQHGTKGSQRTWNGSSRNGQWRRAALLGSKLVEPHPCLARDLRAAGRRGQPKPRKGGGTAEARGTGGNGGSETGDGSLRVGGYGRGGFPEILGPGSGLGEEAAEAVVGGMERGAEGWGGESVVAEEEEEGR
jgi:hypothetical protein